MDNLEVFRRSLGSSHRKNNANQKIKVEAATFQEQNQTQARRSHLMLSLRRVQTRRTGRLALYLWQNQELQQLLLTTRLSQ